MQKTAMDWDPHGGETREMSQPVPQEDSVHKPQLTIFYKVSFNIVICLNLFCK